MKTINIYGAGLFGVLLAQKLSELHNSSNTKINLIDRGPSILQSWRSIRLAEKELNSGFHGIEAPRAQKTIDYLSKSINMDDLIRIDNYKLILINNSLLPFKSMANDWPVNFKCDLSNTNMTLVESHQLDEDEIRNELKKSSLGQLMNLISYRYSDNIIDAMHLLYPWFYPFENRFSDKDECYNTQNKVQAGVGISHYLIPRIGIFSSLIDSISTSLKRAGVRIYTNSNIDIREKLHCNNSKEMNIWAASGLTLSKILNLPIYNAASKNLRFLHFIVLRAKRRELEKFTTQFIKIPSEIICANDKVIGLSRISFPTLHETKCENEEDLVLVEYYSREPKMNLNEINSIEKCIVNSLGIKCHASNETKMRPLHIINPNNAEFLTKNLDQSLQGKSLLVPFKYWWPINMAKCGEAVDNCIADLF